MAFDPDRPADLTNDFPLSVPNVKINPDLDNPVHGPHFDIITGINGGIDKLRIDPSGDVIGGETPDRSSQDALGAVKTYKW